MNLSAICLPVAGLVLLVSPFLHASGIGKDNYPLPFTPDPERLANDIERFAFADEVDMPPEGGIVCVGSSSMRFWHDRIREDLEGLSIIPRGFGGSQYTDVIYYADELILKYRPRAVLIYEGDNDANAGKHPQRIFADFKFLVDICQSQMPGLRFYVISAKPSIARWEIAEQMQEANKLIRKHCRKREDVVFIDLWKVMLGKDKQPLPDIFTEDQLHLNEKGYDIWTAAIAPILQEGEAAFEEEGE
ncbi:MAG: GDSL-type esterase/lipase family protein [Puniceicoccaceae bacterium]